MDFLMRSFRPVSFDAFGRSPAFFLSSGMLLILSTIHWEEAPGGAGDQQHQEVALVDEQACSLGRPEQRYRRARDKVPVAPKRSVGRARRMGLPR